jgi:hypothetical protein
MPETAGKHQPERPPLLLAQGPARTCAAGDVPRRRDGAAGAPWRVGGQLLAAPEYRLCQAVAYVVFARTAAPGPARALGNDVRDNTHGQRRIA